MPPRTSPAPSPGSCERISVRDGGKTDQVAGRRRDVLLPQPGPRRSGRPRDGGSACDGAGLPPAHVGLHAGPVLYQAGDYYGQTVNLSARIADYARPAEVLVSQAVADACTETGIGFADIGPVELKGVSGTVNLLRPHLV